MMAEPGRYLNPSSWTEIGRDKELEQRIPYFLPGTKDAGRQPTTSSFYDPAGDQRRMGEAFLADLFRPVTDTYRLATGQMTPEEQQQFALNLAIDLAASAIPLGIGRAAAQPVKAAVRAARAEKAGFRMDMPLAHGTAPIEEFTAFDLRRAGSTVGATPPRTGSTHWAAPPHMGVWLEVRRPGQEAAIAEEFAEMAAKKTGAAPRIMPLVHRADKPGVIDLTGNELNHEIAATLDDLWSKGYDAVMLRNYTSPGGKSGDILVVRDPAQLRVPHAEFDPKKRDSNNLLASLAGLGAIPAGSSLMPPAAPPNFASR